MYSGLARRLRAGDYKKESVRDKTLEEVKSFDIVVDSSISRGRQYLPIIEIAAISPLFVDLFCWPVEHVFVGTMYMFVVY